MKRLVVAGALVCVVIPAVCQAGGKLVWLRRLTLAAACAASAWDIQTTRVAVSRGAIEGNRFLAGPDGQPRWSRIVGLKVGLCAGSAALQEWRLPGRSHPQLTDAAWSAANAAIAGRFLWVSIENRRVAARLRPEAAVVTGYPMPVP